MEMTVRFPQGLIVEAEWKNHVIRTDQTVKDGGTDSAPAPFDLFLASIATCAGIYALRFCQERSIDTAGLALTMSMERNPEEKRISKIGITLTTPPGFPEKYRPAIIRAMDQCAVKRHIMEKPEFEIALEESPAA